MADRVKEVARNEATVIKTQTIQAARSAAYLYPIKGIFYFLSHRDLWKPLTSSLLPTLTLGTAITIGMFALTYLPQMAVMTFTSGPLAAISAALLVLSESSTLFTILAKTFLIEDKLIDTFDGVLVSRDAMALVGEGRQMKTGSGVMGKLGKLTKRPFEKLAPSAIIRYFLYLPLNFIPVAGTIMFIILRGKNTGPAAHSRYFQLKGWGSTQRKEHVEVYKAAYTSFGVASVLLELVPVASIFFAFTNTVGAALWAADMEKGNVSKEGTAPELREKATRAE